MSTGQRTAAVLAALVAFAVLFVYWRQPGPENPPAPLTQAAQDQAVSNALARQSPATVAAIHSNFNRVRAVPANADSATAGATAPVRAGEPQPLVFTNFAAATVLENMGRAVRQYGQMFGGNPVGTNPEITSQLSGKNPRHINFLDSAAGMTVNGDGELVDPWGTPYFFHQLSGTEMEIHSAGPDRIMWTTDDLVTR